MVSFGQIETAVMTFDKTVKNFNMIGDVAKAVFPYKNTRDSSLRIVDVEGSRNSIFITNQRETVRKTRTRGKVRKTRTRETSVRGEKKSDYQGIGLSQIILIGIIAVPLVLGILYFTKSPTRKGNIKHLTTIETPQEIKKSNFCSNCGISINEKTAFCTNCGTKIT